jgi:non-ribosomal peptide synthetase component F
MEQALESLAQTLERSPHHPVRQLNVLPASERTLLLNTWNTTEASCPDHLCVHHLFEAQVARTPEATALIFEGEVLSYRELNARANRLAHRLISRASGQTCGWRSVSSARWPWLLVLWRY